MATNAKGKVDIKNIFITSGAMMATLIGSGFATGQEIIQYFVAYGWTGLLGIFAIMAGFAFVGHSFLTVGYDNRNNPELSKPNDIFKIYAGKAVGAFYYYFTVFFLFLSYSVMIAGSGATITQQYGTPFWVGAGGMLVVVVATVALGLEKLTNVLGNLGPLIAISALALGAYALATNFGNLGDAPALIEAAVESELIQVASTSWWLAALNYVGFNMMWIAGFLAMTGRTSSNSRREASLGGIVGSVGFCAAIIVMFLGFMASFEIIAGSQVPTLVLANNIAPWVGIAFSVIVLLGIYTSAVTLLWNVVASFAEDKTSKSRILAVVLGIVGYIIGSLLEFDELINLIYVLNGYIGMVLLAIMIVRTIQWRSIPKEI